MRYGSIGAAPPPKKKKENRKTIFFNEIWATYGGTCASKKMRYVDTGTSKNRIHKKQFYKIKNGIWAIYGGTCAAKKMRFGGTGVTKKAISKN